MLLKLIGVLLDHDSHGAVTVNVVLNIVALAMGTFQTVALAYIAARWRKDVNPTDNRKE